jgi:hypothetical protein
MAPASCWPLINSRRDEQRKMSSDKSGAWCPLPPTPDTGPPVTTSPRDVTARLLKPWPLHFLRRFRTNGNCERNRIAFSCERRHGKVLRERRPLSCQFAVRFIKERPIDVDSSADWSPAVRPRQMSCILFVRLLPLAPVTAIRQLLMNRTLAALIIHLHFQFLERPSAGINGIVAADDTRARPRGSPLMAAHRSPVRGR